MLGNAACGGGPEVQSGSSRDLADKTALDLSVSAILSEMANDNTFFTGSLEDTEKVMGGTALLLRQSLPILCSPRTGALLVTLYL